MTARTSNIALVADWLPTYGGAEHVIAEFCALWPTSPLFTTVAARGKLGPLDAADIRTSSLQAAYRIVGDHKMLLPWMPRAIERIDLRGFDIVLSSSHAVGKGIVPPASAHHICYCHTPMRYAWEMENEYLDDFRVPRALRRTIRMQLKRLRRWDLTTAKRVDVFLANSRAVQERIARIYGRESIVVPPPVEERFFDEPLAAADPRGTGYVLAVGRLVPYKRFDLLIEAANALAIPLKIAGDGQDFQRLKTMAGPTVEMLGYVPGDTIPSLYANAEALLFPQIEDAGVALLEAQACGTPVIALNKGGAPDAIDDGRSGILFGEQTVDALRDALARFATMRFDRAFIRERARQFSASRFREHIAGIVQSQWEAAAAHASLDRVK